MIELISIHIPKTAGRSFAELLRGNYGNALQRFDKGLYQDKAKAEQEFLAKINPAKIRAIHGHLHYEALKDLHEETDAKIVCWLRDPVERVISNHAFFLQRAVRFPEDAELQRRKNEPLLDYAVLETSRNRMSRFLSGLDLEEFDFVGLLEHFKSDFRVLEESMAWERQEIPLVNVNKNKSQASDEERAQIAEWNRDDVALYERAKALRVERIETTGR